MAQTKVQRHKTGIIYKSFHHFSIHKLLFALRPKPSYAPSLFQKTSHFSSMKQVKLSVLNREQKGRGPARRLRAKGEIPAILYGKGGAHPLSVQEAELRKLLKTIKGTTAIVEVSDEKGKKALSLLQEIQRNPQTDRFIHVDFREISPDEMMSATLLVRTKGESIGVKSENGVMEILLHEIEVKCLPSNLPEFIEVEVSALHAGESVHVRELPSIQGVSYTMDPELVVISITEPDTGEETTEAGVETSPAPTQ